MRRSLDRSAAAALRLLPPETAHDLAIAALAGLPWPPRRRRWPEGLHSRVLGLEFRHPVGLAAGFDKDARVWPALDRLGWGFAEVGAITPAPQKGNPRPRLFRLPGRAVVNRMGFNSAGVDAVRPRLGGMRPEFPVLVNLGVNRKTRDPADDWLRVLRGLFGLAAGFAINISSPNTTGLRELQGRRLRAEIERVVGERNRLAGDGPAPPLLVKLSPDLDATGLRQVAGIAIEAGIDGIIATNSSAELRQRLAAPPAAAAGGLSGAPLRERAEAALRVLRLETRGAVPLIGVGGILTADDAYRRIRAGASLIQLYTAIVWEGVGVGAAIAEGLAARLEQDGFASIADAVGIDCD